MKERLSEYREGQAGFTLTEVMVAASIALLVVSAAMTLFIWCAREFSTCSKIAWSQNEAMQSSVKIVNYIRNASRVDAIDTAKGRWVQLHFPDNTTAKLIYTNATAALRDGQLLLKRSAVTDKIVTRGVTAIMNSGFTLPVFTLLGSSTNTVHIAYRVSEPVAGGTQAADDADFAAIVQISACLRNSGH